jgi:hypothetical protein
MEFGLLQNEKLKSDTLADKELYGVNLVIILYPGLGSYFSSWIKAAGFLLASSPVPGIYF